jgi:nucleotide-binding universal stress UspA family protein
MKPILAGYDGSDHARDAIARAAELFPGADAVVLTVAEPVRTWPDHDPGGLIGMALARAAGLVAELDDIAAQIAARTADEGAAVAIKAGLRARPLALSGQPGAVIVETAVEHDVSVIVLGARGLSPAKAALLGSVSAGVLHRCDRPVLIVPSPDRSARAIGS